MKKLFSLILVLATMLSISSCNGEKERVSTSEPTATTEEGINTQTNPVSEKKIYDFNDGNIGGNVYITAEDVQTLYDESKKNIYGI